MSVGVYHREVVRNMTARTSARRVIYGDLPIIDLLDDFGEALM